MHLSPICRSLLPWSLLLLLLAACQGDGERDGTAESSLLPISLVERWDDVEIDSPQAVPELPGKAELRFDDSEGGLDFTFKAVQGVEELTIKEGRLTGRTTSENPVILLETTEALGAEDALWSAELRLQVSGGTRAGLHLPLDPGPPMPVVLGRIEAWPLSSPLQPGDETRTYSIELDKVFTFEMPLAENDITRILVRPSNASGVNFAIESVRLVFRRERLASIDSGPGWHGLGEVFREALVSRSPEVLRFPITLPSNPALFLSTGTVEEVAPNFAVRLVPEDGEVVLLETLVPETTEQWKNARLDLSPWAGERVTIELAAESEEPGSLAFWGAPTVRSSTTTEDERPQAVVVFLADTLRSDHLDAWGHERETAPNLTGLATEGVRFADTLAQSTWTKVSVSSLLTSLYPSTTDVVDINDRITAAETTLAEAFREAGYATFATSSVPFSGQLTNLHQGVEVMYETGALPDTEDFYQSKTARFWVDAYLEWLELHKDVPTFAFVHAMDPHSPFQPEPPFDTLFTAEDGAERFAEQSKVVEPYIESPLLKRFMAPSREELEKAGVDEASFVRHEHDWYDGSIRGLDTHLGRLVETAESFGLADDMLLTFVSDHGEEFLEHGNHWHGITVYGEVANVPWVLWGKGVPQGQVIEQTVQNVDVLPTLLDLAGLPIPERAQGRSLVPLLRGESEGRAVPAFTELRTREPGDDDWDRFAVVQDGWKLIWNDRAPEDIPKYELYQRSVDPLDSTDLAAEEPERVAQMAAELERWRSWAEAQRLDPEEAMSDLSAEELERLRSLGYVE